MDRIIHSGFAVLIAMAVWPLVATIAPRLEGAFFPVVANVTISRIEPRQFERVAIWGTARKLRDCNFDSILWEHISGDRRSRAAIFFEEPSKVRSAGWFDFGPWSVQMTEDEIRAASVAVVYHRCHQLWLTETRFYP